MQNELLEKLKVKKTPKAQEAVYVNIPGKKINVVGSSRVDLQACKLEYSIVSPK